MKLISFVLTCVAIALIATACTETATPTNSSTPTGAASPAASAPTAPGDQFAAARASYAKNCEACHGPNGAGGLVKVNDKQIKVASLKSRSAIRHTDEQLAKVIANGEEAMPPFEDKMTPAEITDMVRFIRANFQGKQ